VDTAWPASVVTDLILDAFSRRAGAGEIKEPYLKRFFASSLGDRHRSSDQVVIVFFFPPLVILHTHSTCETEAAAAAIKST
jgi:hypothetical protein